MGNPRLWIGLLVTIAFLGLLVLRVDVGETVRRLGRANYVFLLPGLGLYATAVLGRTLRWRYLLLPLKGVGLGRLVPVVVVGYMANNLLPMRLGEVVRSYYVGEREGVSKAAAFATVVVERVFDGLALLFFLVVAAAFLPVAGLVKGLGETTRVPWPILAGGTVLSFVVVSGVLLWGSRGPAAWTRLAALVCRPLPARWKGQVVGLVDLFATGLSTLRNPGRLAAVFLLSVPVWLAEAATSYVIALGFGLEAPLGGLGGMATAIVAMTAIANLATSLPSSQGGVGPFEFFAVATLVLLGVEAEVATAYVVALHLTLLVPVTVVGLVYLWVGKESLLRLMRLPPMAAKASAAEGRVASGPVPREELP
ncbi:MAG: flippase-like domain-containing protein [Chloroflexi bacterium]|nr:flippase-like domain-containing protein [Chloroflexota bacterium]